MAITQLHQQRLQDQTNTGSMYRQAIINGNFDIWQRGTTATNPTNATFPTADRYLLNIVNTGTLPTTIIHSRQSITPGFVQPSRYFHRVNVNGAGSGFGVSDYYAPLRQKIEHGTMALCGASKQVTVSFWARSDISGKKLAINLYQDYGTGGSPSSTEVITGQTWTLTSSFAKYTATFTTNTLVGKTFGTGNNDNLSLQFYIMWGTNIAPTLGTVGAETFVGSGNVDITQIQLCSGSEALPFEPKSYNQELIDCQRYCFVPAANAQNLLPGSGMAFSTTAAGIVMPLPVQMRGAIAVAATGSDWQLWSMTTGAYDITAVGLSTYSQTSVELGCTGAVGLTAERVMFLRADASFPRYMVISSEL
jgi:hypothetical protein